MASYKTPGVYVKEISIFPPSVAQVETAIPAFIGYTEKAVRNGESLINVPTRITSLLDYGALFGGAYEPSSISVSVDSGNNYAVGSITISTRYRMFDSLRLFFDNGGGECYIVSVGLYPTAVGLDPGLLVGLRALEQYDEPTMILFPDAIDLANDSEFYLLQQQALAQCNKLQDRVAILDLKENNSNSLEMNRDNFRNGIGINNLKYGAAYTPYLYSSFPKTVHFSTIQNSVTDSAAANAPVDLLNVTSDASLNTLVQNAMNASGDQGTYNSSVNAITTGSRQTIRAEYEALRSAVFAPAGSESANLETLINNVFVGMLGAAAGWRNGGFVGQNLILDMDAYISNDFREAIETLVALEKCADVIAFLPGTRNATNIYGNGTGGLNLQAAPLDWVANSTDPTLTDVTADPAGTYDTGGLTAPQIAANIVSVLNGVFDELIAFFDSIASAASTHVELAESVLYDTHPIIGNIINQVQKELSILPPSGAIAGVYSYVDNNRGVWKAPANVSVSSVSGPVTMIDDDRQEALNVDVTAGKSINAIRAFTGKGTLVWGARTLAGNDNEWRYVSVRRFFNMAEESIKKSTAWAVFEPNDASTWDKVRSMIRNFLLQQWKEGALQGATPEDAFFVNIGLGLTMTYDDILNGIMNVEIGMAVVRPAEFIILKFSHKVVENA